MIDIVGKKKWYFLFSLLIIIPGVIALLLWGLRLSIDFTGGSRLTLVFPKTVERNTVEKIQEVLREENIAVSTVQPSENSVIIRTIPLNEAQAGNILANIKEGAGEFRQEGFETIGPTIGEETALNAVYAVIVSSILILLYLAWSFRKVPKPASSWRFGITTIITLLHDVFILIGLFSILGHFFHIEVDSLFITALLTIMGFSVHDTIVVFDRIREKLLRGGGQDFPRTVNDALLETMTRSINTAMTTLLVLFALLLFGGDSMRWFIVALFVGIVAGTYSSIFNAAPLLVLWDEWDKKRRGIKK